MKSPALGRKPSERHIIWTDSGKVGTKRFHEALLKKWCRKFAAGFEEYSRVDHERSEEPRRQYQCVFSYQKGAGDSFDMGDQEWEITTQKTPRTFVEIDEEGVMRIQGWSIERILDVEQLWYDGSELVVKTSGKDNDLRIDARDLIPE